MSLTAVSPAVVWFQVSLRVVGAQKPVSSRFLGGLCKALLTMQFFGMGDPK